MSNSQSTLILTIHFVIFLVFTMEIAAQEVTQRDTKIYPGTMCQFNSDYILRPTLWYADSGVSAINQNWSRDWPWDDGVSNVSNISPENTVSVFCPIIRDQRGFIVEDSGEHGWGSISVVVYTLNVFNQDPIKCRLTLSNKYGIRLLVTDFSEPNIYGEIEVSFVTDNIHQYYCDNNYWNPGEEGRSGLCEQSVKEFDANNPSGYEDMILGQASIECRITQANLSASNFLGVHSITSYKVDELRTRVKKRVERGPILGD